MQRHHMMVILSLLLSVLAAQTWSAYLPKNSLNQLDTIQEQPKNAYYSRHLQKYEEGAVQTREDNLSENGKGSNESGDAAVNGNEFEEDLSLKHLKLLHRSTDKNDDVVPVDGKAVRDTMSPVQRYTPENAVDGDSYDVDGAQEDVDELEAEDEGAEAENTELHAKQRKRRELSEWFIAPNTRWCGRGNTANGTYNHLGGEAAADKCCRKHDHCSVYISAMSNRYELFNYRPYTLSHCNCDRRFRTCLKLANDDAATTIGQLFFNMVQTQCFVLRTERICVKRDPDGTCTEEKTKQKAYLRNNKKF